MILLYQNIVPGIPTISLPDVCTASPLRHRGKAPCMYAWPNQYLFVKKIECCQNVGVNQQSL